MAGDKRILISYSPIIAQPTIKMNPAPCWPAGNGYTQQYQPSMFSTPHQESKSALLCNQSRISSQYFEAPRLNPPWADGLHRAWGWSVRPGGAGKPPTAPPGGPGGGGIKKCAFFFWLFFKL